MEVHNEQNKGVQSTRMITILVDRVTLYDGSPHDEDPSRSVQVGSGQDSHAAAVVFEYFPTCGVRT